MCQWREGEVIVLDNLLYESGRWWLRRMVAIGLWAQEMQLVHWKQMIRSFLRRSVGLMRVPAPGSYFAGLSQNHDDRKIAFQGYPRARAVLRVIAGHSAIASIVHSG